MVGFLKDENDGNEGQGFMVFSSPPMPIPNSILEVFPLLTSFVMRCGNNVIHGDTEEATTNKYLEMKKLRQIKGDPEMYQIHVSRLPMSIGGSI